MMPAITILRFGKRELLDQVMTDWETFRADLPGGRELGICGFAYWLIRHSGYTVEAPAMDRETIYSLAQPRADENVELAEIRRWLAKQPASELWGLTPATRVAFLLALLEQK